MNLYTTISIFIIGVALLFMVVTSYKIFNHIGRRTSIIIENQDRFGCKFDGAMSNLQMDLTIFGDRLGKDRTI